MDRGSVPELSEGREETNNTPRITKENENDDEDPNAKLIEHDHLKVFKHDSEQNRKTETDSLTESKISDISEGPQ